MYLVLCICLLCIDSNSNRALSVRGINADLNEWTMYKIQCQLRCLSCLCDLKLLYEPPGVKPLDRLALKLTTPADADSHDAN